MRSSETTPPPRALVSGATSGIGRALTLRLATAGYRVAAIGRRSDRLDELTIRFPDAIVTRVVDLRDHAVLPKILDQLVSELGGLDLCVINAGVDHRNPELLPEPEIETVDVNVKAFVIMAVWAADLFKRQRSGHIVGMSSVAAFWGNGRTLAYNASKAFELRYLEGLHNNLAGLEVWVTDVRPGFVATEMTAGRNDMFWVSSPEKAAEQIYRAILKRKRVVYVTRRWRFIAWLMRLSPYQLYRRLTVKS